MTSNYIGFSFSTNVPDFITHQDFWHLVGPAARLHFLIFLLNSRFLASLFMVYAKVILYNTRAIDLSRTR